MISKKKKKKVFSKFARDFPADIGNSSGFSGRKQVISKKKTKKKCLLQICKRFSGQNRKFKRFFRPKSGGLQTKKTEKGLHPKNVMKSGVSPQKTPIWAPICTPVAPSLLISPGHSPCLGGTSSHLGGTAPVCPPWRRV